MSDDMLPSLELPMLSSDDTAHVTHQILHVINAAHASQTQKLSEYLEKNKSLLSKIFPNALDRHLRSAQLLQVRTESEFKQQLLELAVKTKLAAFDESLRAWLTMLKLDTHSHVAEFAMQRYTELEDKIHDSGVKFFARMRERHAIADSYKDMPAVESAYRKTHITDAIEQHGALVDQFIKDAGAVLKEYAKRHA